MSTGPSLASTYGYLPYVPAKPTVAISLTQDLLTATDYNTGDLNKRQGIFTKLTTFAYSSRLRILQRIRQSQYHGWRMGVLLGCYMSTIVLLCNIAIIITGFVKGYSDDGIADLITGDEENVSRWNTALHVLINALSTVLLSGSNYTMQVLSSPTRDDIDKAHVKSRWLEVGILSPRNLRSLPRKRACLCLLLSLSSIPLHLL